MKKNYFSKSFHFKANSDKVNCLRIAKIDIVVNLINNNTLDFNNEECLEETIKTVNSGGCLQIGTGKILLN